MDQLELNKQRQGEDKDLRRARDQFNSPKTQRATSEAMLAVGATDHDVERILAQLRSRLHIFKRLGKMKLYRPAVIAWVTRQAHLNVALRELLQQPHSFNPTLLFTALPTYDGEVSIDALRAWAESVMQTEAEAVASVGKWIERYRLAAYAGAWEILKGCPELGVGGFDPVRVFSDGTTSRLWHPIVEEIVAPVWLWMWENAFDLATSEVPIHIRIQGKAKRAALLWKFARIEKRRTFVNHETLERRIEVLERLMETDPSGLAEAEKQLLKEAEYIGIENAGDVDRAFAKLDVSDVVAILGEGDDSLETLAENPDESKDECEDELEELPLLAA
jgi:hypothetical protein